MGGKGVKFAEKAASKVEVLINISLGGLNYLYIPAPWDHTVSLGRGLFRDLDGELQNEGGHQPVPLAVEAYRGRARPLRLTRQHACCVASAAPPMHCLTLSACFPRSYQSMRRPAPPVSSVGVSPVSKSVKNISQTRRLPPYAPGSRLQEGAVLARVALFGGRVHQFSCS